MNPEKIMRGMGHVLFWSYAAVNILYAFRTQIFPFGPEVAGEYSIYASEQFFIIYHIWGAVLAVLCSVMLWRDNTRLFMISLGLWLIVIFYPYFTSSPIDQARAKDKYKKENAGPPTNLDGSDSLKLDSTVIPSADSLK